MYMYVLQRSSPALPALLVEVEALAAQLGSTARPAETQLAESAAAEPADVTVGASSAEQGQGQESPAAAAEAPLEEQSSIQAAAAVLQFDLELLDTLFASPAGKRTELRSREEEEATGQLQALARAGEAAVGQLGGGQKGQLPPGLAAAAPAVWELMCRLMHPTGKGPARAVRLTASFLVLQRVLCMAFGEAPAAPQPACPYCCQHFLRFLCRAAAWSHGTLASGL